MSLRILMLNNEFPPKGGGMGTVNKALFAHFSEDPELEIDLITSSISNRASERHFAGNIRIHEVGVGTGNIHHAANGELVRYAFRAYAEASKLISGNLFHLVFAWSGLPAGAVALVLKKRYRLPFITRVSGPDIPGFERRYDRIYPVLKPALKAVWRNSTPLLAKCQEEIDLIAGVLPGLEVEVIPNGVDLSRFSPGEPVGEEGPLRVVCSARLIERKGQRFLISAVARLKEAGVDIQAEILGDGDARTAYSELAADLGVADRINFAGFIAPEKMPGRLADAHVFVLPSYFEGMSLATLEAMAAGLPLITTKTGGTKDLVLEGITGFTIDWGDVERLTAVLKLMSEDREMVRRMGRESRNQAEKYGWDEIGETYRNLFERFASTDSRRI